MRVAIYISNHGFGHATRMAALAGALNEGGIFCYLCTDRPGYLFEELDPLLYEHRICRIDFGLMQKDWIHPDREATITALGELLDRSETLIAAECAFLIQEHVDLVIADIPFLAIEAAARANIPVVAISNFNWLYMYESMLPQTEQVNGMLERIRSMYRKANLALQLPLSDAQSMRVFARCETTGLLARYRRRDSAGLRRMLNISPSARVVIVSFGSGELLPFRLEDLLAVPDIVVLSRYADSDHPRFRHIPPQIDFTAILAAADVVITKMGYGMLAESMVAGLHIICTDRKDFQEDIPLKEGLKRYKNHTFIPNEALPATDWVSVFRCIGRFNAGQKVPRANQEIAARCLRLWSETCGDIGARRAVIDVGTNNILLLWAGITDSGFVIHHRAAAVSALGKGMKDHRLTPAGIRNARNILDRYIRLSQAYSGESGDSIPGRIRVVGTSCSREAENIAELSTWQSTRFGVPYEIIPEEEEASLGALVVRREFAEHSGIVTFDIGGGSIEFTCMKDGQIRHWISLRLGLRRLETLFGNRHGARLDHVKRELAPLAEWDVGDSTLVGIGGTVTNLYAMKLGLSRYDNEMVHRGTLTASDIEEDIAAFRGKSDADIARMIPFEPLRAGIILSGAEVIGEIMKIFGKNALQVCDRGLQFGILYRELEQMKKPEDGCL